MARLIRRLAGLERTDICKLLLAKMEQLKESLRADIALNPEYAAAILVAGDTSLTSQYMEILENILIPAPGISGFSYETWAEMINPGHIERLTQFLDILKLDAGCTQQEDAQIGHEFILPYWFFF